MHLFAEREYEFPARIFLPSGHDKVFKNYKEAEEFAETLHKRYEAKKRTAKNQAQKEAAQEFYDDYLKLTNDLKKIRTSYNLRERKGGSEPSYEGLAKFPMRFTAPSGAIYTLNNFSDFKKFKDKDFWNKELEARASSKEFPVSRENLMKAADADYRYLMGEREKLLSKGWQNKGHNPGWYLENNPLNTLANRQMANLKEGERREKELRGESKPWLFFNSQKSTENQTPPAATAEQPQPAEAKPEARSRSRSRSRVRIAEQRPARTRARTPAATAQQEERKATVKEPVKVDEDLLSAAILSKIDSDNTLTDEQKEEFKILAEESHKNGFEKVLEDGKKLIEEDSSLTPEQVSGFNKKLEDYTKYKDEVAKSLQEEQAPEEEESEDVEYFSPHEEDEGEVYDTEHDLEVNPETLTRLGIHAAGRRLAREPYEENKEVGVPDFNEMELEGIRTFNELAEDAKQPKRRSESYEQVQKLLNDYIDPERRNERVETLKDRLISTVRERAQQRLMKAYEKLGMKLSAAGMGRSGYEEKMRQEMAKEMEIELYERELQETMKLHQQEEENAKNRLSTALQAYIINQKEEEARKNEQRRAAADRIATGKYVSDRLQLEKDKKAEEFVRRKEHPWRAQERLADLLNRTSLGEPKPYEPLPDEIKRPEVVPQAAPTAVEREIGPTHVPPALGHAPEKDTSFADTTAAGLGLGKLALDVYNTFGAGSKKDETKPKTGTTGTVG